MFSRNLNGKRQRGDNACFATLPQNTLNYESCRSIVINLTEKKTIFLKFYLIVSQFIAQELLSYQVYVFVLIYKKKRKSKILSIESIDCVSLYISDILVLLYIPTIN